MMGWPCPSNRGKLQSSANKFEGGHPLKNVNTIGIDLAKNNMQLHGVDSSGKFCLRRTLRRDQVPLFFANLPACLVGGGMCHFRVLAACHRLSRTHRPSDSPSFCQTLSHADKNDANDAAAVCEAVQRPYMRFVPHKSQEQSDIQAIHRVRKGLVQARTAAINQVRGLLAENGIVIKQGACHVRSHLPTIVEDHENHLSAIMRELLAELYEHIVALDARIDWQSKALQLISNERDVCWRLMEIPGVGFLTATILLTVTGIPNDFKNGREFATFLGLVPR